MLEMLRQFEQNPAMQNHYREMQEMGEGATKSVFANFEGADPAELFYRAYGFIYRETAKSFRAHELTQCKKGCNACCHLRVSSTVPEVIAIHEWMKKNLSESRQAEIYYKLKCFGYENKQLLKSMTWIKKQKSCAFLEFGNCAIYKFRPLTCRGMNSLDSKLCYEGYKERKYIQFPLNGAQKFAFEGISTGIDKAIKEKFGIRVMQVELHQTLLHVAQRSLAIEDWLGGSDEFKEFEVELEL